jgi:transposase-like protein
MPKRTYKLTEKEKREAARLYKKGYTTHEKLSKKLGVSRQKVSNWLKAEKLGKRVDSPFWRDVKAIREMKGVDWKKAKTEVKYSKKWFVKRQARLKGISKAKDQYGELWQRVKKGEVDASIFETKEVEDIMEYVGYD